MSVGSSTRPPSRRQLSAKVVAEQLRLALRSHTDDISIGQCGVAFDWVALARGGAGPEINPRAGRCPDQPVDTVAPGVGIFRPLNGPRCS
jgi:hypothetical protein